MSSLSSLNRNVLRISGLNSGLDTDSIVQAMLATHRNKVYNQFRTQTKLEWKQDKYKEVNNELRKLKEDFSTVLKQDQNMLSEYNYRKYSVNMTNSTDSAYVGITAGTYAKTGSTTVDYVKRLATATSVTSKEKVTGSAGQGLKLSDSMKTVDAKLRLAGKSGLAFTTDESGNEVIEFNLDGHDFTIGAYATLESAISTINANSSSMKLSYTQLTDKFTLESRTMGENSELSFSNNSFLSAFGISNTIGVSDVTIGQNAVLSINGVQIERDSNNFEIDGITYDLRKTFNVSGGLSYVKQLATPSYVDAAPALAGSDKLKLTDTLAEASAKLALPFDFDAGGKMTFSLGGKEFTFDRDADTVATLIQKVNAGQTKVSLGFMDTNEFPDVAFRIQTRQTGASADLGLVDSGFLASIGIVDAASAAIVAGKDAIFGINGTEHQYGTNDFIFERNEYHLTEVFVESPDSTKGKSVSFSVTRDLDGTVDLIKKYVDAYNELIEKLNTMLTEKANRNYGPLHDDEKAELTEKQIEKWEELARAGLMRNDSQLQSLVYSLRTSFYVKANNASKTLADIGIGGTSSTMTQYEGAKIGKMYIDEVKLRQALTDNPEEVFQMFTAKDESGNVDNMGLATRINALIDGYIKSNERETQYYNEQAISRAKTRYNDLVTAMYAEEDRLWKRFTALEKTMSSLNSQSQWIGNQMLGTGA